MMIEITTTAGGREDSASANTGAPHEVINGQRSEPTDGLPWDDRLYEIVKGQRVEKPMGFYECGIAFLLGYYLEHHARNNQLGRVRVEMMFRIDAANALDRRPDVAFVSYQRWPKKRRLPRTNAAEVVPDLTVEVVSPTNLAKDIAAKVEEYFRAGVRLVWVIYPDLNEVYVYESPTKVRILHQNDELDGAPVLSGFRLKVAALFEDELETEEPESTRA
jgi:Uma2 family endonuclease